MKEQGIVTKIISPDLVEVAFQRNEACAKCRACHGLDEKTVGIESINAVGAKKGELVEIDIPSGAIVKSSVIVFLVPIFCLIAGYLITAWLLRLFGLIVLSERIAVLVGLTCLALSFYAVKWYDANIQQKEACRANIIRIIR
jgi:sigma-E factor negative regulatory protein RseC